MRWVISPSHNSRPPSAGANTRYFPVWAVGHPRARYHEIRILRDAWFLATHEANRPLRSPDDDRAAVRMQGDRPSLPASDRVIRCGHRPFAQYRALPASPRKPNGSRSRAVLFPCSRVSFARHRGFPQDLLGFPASTLRRGSQSLASLLDQHRDLRLSAVSCFDRLALPGLPGVIRVIPGGRAQREADDRKHQGRGDRDAGRQPVATRPAAQFLPPGRRPNGEWFLVTATAAVRRANAPADAKRSAGHFSIAFKQIVSRSRGTAGLSDRGGGGSLPAMWASNVVSASVTSNGSLPVSIR